VASASPWLCKALELAARATIRFTIAKSSNVDRARRSIPSDHFVTGRNGFDELAAFFAVDLCAGHPLAIDARAPGGLQLVELRFEGSTHGSDAGVTEA
jgi:hypothetical protein